MTAPAKRTSKKSPLKRIYHTARNLPYRVLHRRQHAQACRRVLKLDNVRSILVVCYGNICRSPYLEAVLRRDLPEIACRVVILWGARDAQLPLEDAFEYARRLRARLRLVADCGHLVIVERPHAFLDALAEVAG